MITVLILKAVTVLMKLLKVGVQPFLRFSSRHVFNIPSSEGIHIHRDV